MGVWWVGSGAGYRTYIYKPTYHPPPAKTYTPYRNPKPKDYPALHSPLLTLHTKLTLSRSLSLPKSCYNDCPSDPGRYTVTQQQVPYCNAAQANSLLYSTSTRVTKTSSATKTSAPTTTAAKTTAASATATALESSGAAAGAGLELGLGVAAVVLGVWGF